jgi:imidazolonepropionase-like amidohydrolase
VIAAGAPADMLVLDGGPSRDLGIPQNPGRFPKAVVKDGKFYKDEITA